MKRDWNFMRDEVGNGWFLIKFSNPLDKDEVWENRPFKAKFNSITHVDQWVKIPFIPTEYWTWHYLNQISSCVGQPIKLDKFTSENAEKGQFARVCLNLNITKPVPRSITLNFGYDIQEFFLSYEGVWEVCLLCGDPKHFLNACPKRPPPCLELVVAQLDEAKLSMGVPGESEGQVAPSDWLTVVPRRRAKPRGNLRKNQAKPYHQPSPVHARPVPSPTQGTGAGLPVIPLANSFQGLQDFQVSTGDTITLNPPAVQPYEDILPDFDPLELAPQGVNDVQVDDELDMDLEIYDGDGFDENDPMFSDCTPPIEAENTKRRKRDVGDLSPSPSAG
ncbi:uncharacterized protein [Spinacia oleracea]|uniref:Uncharacterized protein isoform X2 n=1 Tax=Spinacia oleracea TaxID=3562 RepID=A0ABM3QG81_SPIOL|nr:uncharacterized protein LOC130459187 isoform X2 [Spinacia oleracea]